MQDSVEHVLEVTLAEYSVLATEIRGRSEAQSLLMNIAAVASVGLAGFSLQAEGAGRQVILLLPFVGAVFGLLWLDHHRTILGLGSYIREHSRSEVLAAVSLLEDIPEDLAQQLMRWEWVSRQGASSSRRELLADFATPQAVLFALPGIVGLGFGSYLAIESGRGDTGAWNVLWQVALLALGLALMVYLISHWWSAFKRDSPFDFRAPDGDEIAFLARCRPPT